MIKLLKNLILAFQFFILAIVNSAQAHEVSPFYTRNQSPLIHIFGLPAIIDSEGIVKESVEARVALNIANNFTCDKTSSENLILDGENYRMSFSLNYGLSKIVNLGVEIPYIANNEGIFDNFIEAWHEAFSFPQGGRLDAKSSKINYLYAKDNKVKFDIDHKTDGIGDINLSLGVNLFSDMLTSRHFLALRAGLKLPTGESLALNGSGGTDVFIYLVGKEHDIFSSSRLTVFGAMGLLFLGKSDILNDQKKDLVQFGTLGFGYKVNNFLVPKVQLDWHSPFYRNSDLKQLNSWSAGLSAGITFVISEKSKTYFDLGLVEDIVTKTAPDAVFHFALYKKF